MRYFFCILILFATAILSGCHKSTFECEYTLKLYQTTKEGDRWPLTNGVVHAFYADTADWAVISYADAEAGIITHRRDGQTLKADFMATTDAYGVAVIAPIVRKPVLMVVCNKFDRLYAWKFAEVEEDLERVVVPLNFEPWRLKETYLFGRWTVVDEFLAERPQPEPDPDPNPNPNPNPDPGPDPEPEV